MSSLTEVIKELETSMAAAGIPIKDHVPSRIVPPVLIIGAGSPYITEGDTFDASVMTLNLEVYLLVANGNNQSRIRDLNTKLQAVLPHISWPVEVDQPELISLGQDSVFGVRLRLSNLFDLG